MGCGCGSSILPVLKANPSCHVTATDLSPTAVALLEKAAQAAGIHQSRLATQALDGTDQNAMECLPGTLAPSLQYLHTSAAIEKAV